MFRKLKDLSRLNKLSLAALGIIAVAAIGGAAQPKQANLQLHTTSNQEANSISGNTQTLQKASPVITKTETETQTIHFSISQVNSSALAKGQTEITTAGVNGVETLTYRVTYTSGKQTSKQLISRATTQAPVTQVVSVGTYVAPQPTCPNGTYVNSSGNTVCSPYQSSSTPAGATAQCRDGSYSFSQSRSGTCSHHGGVATWL